ncbi:hypothetical protein ACFFHJ_22485 [Planotetraspora thailandica]|uniref:hypothetical protein n=1 Tax=Planotetraspora thailandica TaxID=487172 RepID=UPI00194F622A|nr:hypothetical protein [Planotetraspora thailandica]
MLVTILLAIVVFSIAKAVIGAMYRNRAIPLFFLDAWQDGWRYAAASARLRKPMAEAAASRRSMVFMGKQIRGRLVWMSWHQWTETHTVRVHRNDRWEDKEETVTFNSTEFFVALPAGTPDVAVTSRTALGGRLRPVRGLGTGDPDFDRAFHVHPQDDPAALGLLSAPLRHAMLAGTLSTWWRIEGAALVLTYNYEGGPGLAGLDSVNSTATTASMMAAVLDQEGASSGVPPGLLDESRMLSAPGYDSPHPMRPVTAKQRARLQHLKRLSEAFVALRIFMIFAWIVCFVLTAWLYR